MRHLRWIGLTLAAMIAALGLMAGTAAATYNANAPSWAGPESDWTGVEVYDCWYDEDLPEPKEGTPCTFEANAPALELTHPLQGHIVTCDVTVEIDVFDNGMTRVNSVDIVRSASDEELCDSIEGDSMPWMNQICERESIDGDPLPVSEYWDAVDISFTLGSGVVAGTVYLQLHNDTADSSPLGVNWASIDSDVEGSGGFHLEDPTGFLFDTYQLGFPTFWVASTEDPCGWVFPEDR